MDVAVLGTEDVCFHKATQVFGDVYRFLSESLGQDGTELLTAIATQLVVRPQPFLQNARKPTQHYVAAQMAIRVVDFLEVIDVEHQQRQFSTMTLRPRDFIAQQRIKLLAIA